MLIRDKNFATSTSAFIETQLIQTSSISQATENQKESSYDNQRSDLHQQTDAFEVPSKIVAKNKHTNANITKTIVEKTQSTCEDDWVLLHSEKKRISSLYIQVCPVAVALRRAGYNVCVLFNLHPVISFFLLNRYHSDHQNLGLNVVSKPLIIDNYFEVNVLLDRKKQALLREQQTSFKEM
jgi:hypothetical protein